jgi:uncharacterized membrane protein YbhN (UPF0104 family)
MRGSQKMKTGTILRSALAGLFGIALVVGLFFLTGMSFKEFIALIIRVRFWPFLGVIACTLFYNVLGAAKWHLIAGVKAPRRFFYTYYTAQAVLIGQFLPLPVAIAGNRAAVMKFKQNTSLKKGFFNALYDMGFDFMTAVLFIPASFLQWTYHFGFGSWLGVGLAILATANFFLIPAVKIFPVSWLVKLELAEGKKSGLLSPRIISSMMLLSALRFGFVVIRKFFGAGAFAIAIPFATIAYAVPPSTISGLVMLTPANLGIAEWTWTYLLALWGVPLATGAFFSVSFRILLFAAQLIVTGMCWLLYKVANRL